MTDLLKVEPSSKAKSGIGYLTTHKQNGRDSASDSSSICASARRTPSRRGSSLNMDRMRSAATQQQNLSALFDRITKNDDKFHQLQAEIDMLKDQIQTNT